MIELTPFLRGLLLCALCVLAAVIFFCLIRALLGPRISDRVVAMNMAGTVVVLIICLLSYLLGEAFLIDVAILYAMLNLLIVVVLCRVATARHEELKEGEKRQKDD